MAVILLGIHGLDQTHGYAIRTVILQSHLDGMPANATGEELMQYLRTYILYLLGNFLVHDRSGDRVHCKYLPLLEDIPTIRSYSWGSACLASLYRGLCDAATPSKKNTTISRCAILIQAWARSRMHIFERLRITPPPFDLPLALRFVGPGTSYNGDPTNDIVAADTMIDHMQPDEFTWVPYNFAVIDPVYPEDVQTCDSDFVTPMPQTRNFFDFDLGRHNFDSPGTRSFNDKNDAYYNSGESTQPPNQPNKSPKNWDWAHFATDEFLNSTWAHGQGQGSSSAPGQGASSALGQDTSSHTSVINFLEVEDDTDEHHELLGFGHRQINPRRCFTGSHLFPPRPPH
ncbi:hypothetical protein TSUD_65190 [Trifolium subterraneum]|uniref:Aminotransferase-like plant mobile domain-containing protein n=1 Tax=Trifolium subterraneum TaxID=3900 RepID=A0A2Z6MI29_TRISU|nr:hypothetical protein TSUD_65190 [Trifolium subterraneum]